jgi:hypothetical protein
MFGFHGILKNLNTIERLTTDKKQPLAGLQQALFSS